MRYHKVATFHFMVLLLTVALYVILLILSFNKHAGTQPRGTEVTHGHRVKLLHQRLDWIEEWRNNLPRQPLIHRHKIRLSESNFPKNDVMIDESDDDIESSVSGDNARFDQSSNPLFSQPFADPGSNNRGIHTKVKSKVNSIFKPLSYIQAHHHHPNSRYEQIESVPKIDDANAIDHGLSNSEMTGDRTSCVALTNIVYIKTHKTGSSTLQNIIYRFGDERNLTFALPERDVYIQSVREFEPSSILPAPPGAQFNIMANHVRFFYKDIKDMMPLDAKYVTIVRKSSDQFSSMYNYFVLESQYKANLEQYSLNPEYFYAKYGQGKFKRHNGRDPMLYDLGMEKSDSESPKKIQEYIEFLDSKFHLVLIMEYFYESLILLKDLMCWDLRMLVHVNNKIRVSLGPEVSTPSVEDQRAADDVVKRLNRWNGGDVKLYDHFNKTLWKKIDAYGRTKMAAEVTELKKLCVRIESECMNGTRIRDISRGSLQQTGLAEYVVKPSQMKNMTCRRLAMIPRTFLSHLRKKHIQEFHRNETG